MLAPPERHRPMPRFERQRRSFMFALIFGVLPIIVGIVGMMLLLRRYS